MFIPKLNIAIPRPASEMIFIEKSTMFGIAIFHLLIIYQKYDLKVITNKFNDYG